MALSYCENNINVNDNDFNTNTIFYFLFFRLPSSFMVVPLCFFRFTLCLSYHLFVLGELWHFFLSPISHISPHPVAVRYDDIQRVPCVPPVCTDSFSSAFLPLNLLLLSGPGTPTKRACNQNRMTRKELSPQPTINLLIVSWCAMPSISSIRL